MTRMVVACSACNHRFEAGGYRDTTCPACGAIAASTRACPRCAGPLGATRIDELVFDVCRSCSGVFIDHATIARAISEHADAVVAVLPRASGRAAAAHTAPTCPTCAVAMDKRMVSGGSGVILDVCKSHGVFLDAGELQTLVTFARQELARAMREGRELGAFDLDTVPRHVPLVEREADGRVVEKPWPGSNGAALALAVLRLLGL